MLGDQSIGPVRLLDDCQVGSIENFQLRPVDARGERLGVRGDRRASILGARDHKSGRSDPTEQPAAVPAGDG